MTPELSELKLGTIVGFVGEESKLAVQVQLRKDFYAVGACPGREEADEEEENTVFMVD